MRNHEEHINAAKHVFTCLCTQKSILPGESKTTRWAEAKVHVTALVDVFRVIGIVVGRRGPGVRYTNMLYPRVASSSVGQPLRPACA